MIQNLEDLKKSLAKTIPDNFKKEDLLNFFNETIKSIPITLDILSDSLMVLKDKKINNIDGYILLGQLASQLELKSSNVDSVINYLIGALEKFKKQSGDIQKYIIDMDDIIIKDNIKLRNAAIYRIVNDIYFVNRYSLDVVNYILTIAKAKKQAVIRGEDINAVSDILVSGESWYKILNDNSLNFTDILVDKYLDFDIEDLKDSGFDTMIPLKNVQADGFLKTIIDKLLGKNKPIRILGEYNFNYSPIFAIGKLYIKQQISKAKSMSDKQEMLKYKILDIKAMRDDSIITNEKMEKAIAHYQSEIDILEYKIVKILDN